MTSKFIIDGPQRAAKANKADLRKALAAKYADELAQAGFFRRLVIRFSLWRELRKAESSPYSLWSRH